MAAWPTKRMDQLCEITSSKRIFAADYVSEGVPFYRGREVTEKYKGNLDVSTELFITEEKFAEIERKFGAPKLGDLLLTSVGTLGSVYVVKPGDRFYCSSQTSLGMLILSKLCLRDADTFHRLCPVSQGDQVCLIACRHFAEDIG